MYLLEDGTQKNICYVLLFFPGILPFSPVILTSVFLNFLNQGPASSLCVDCVAQVRDIPRATPLSPAAGSKAGSIPGSVQEGGSAGERVGPASKAPPPGDKPPPTENRPPPTENRPPLSDTAAGGNTLPHSVSHSADSAPGESGLRTPSKPTATGFNMATSDSKGAVGQVPGSNASFVQGAAVEDAELKFVDVAVNEDGTYQSYVSLCVCVCV